MTSTLKNAAEMSPQELAQACADAMWKSDLASQGLGMQVTHIAPGEATMTMKLTENMSNGHGNCQGGFIFTLADSAFAFACNSYNQITVAQHCSITYLQPGKIGDTLTATATQTSHRGRSGLYDIRVTNQDGEHVAEFRGHSRSVKGTHLPI